MSEITSYRDLIVWQKSLALVTEVYKLTNTFPQDEKFGLVSQMRRCSVSIPSNIAEGRSRGSRKDYRHFIIIAFGSGAELETQVLIAKNLGFLPHDKADKIIQELSEIMKMLNGLISKLDQK